MTHAAFDPRRARRQALGLLAAMGAAALCTVAFPSLPDGPVELKIAAGQLRSQAAELQWLADHADRELPPRFVRAHAHQLARSIEHSGAELASLRPAPPWQAVQPTLQPHAQALLASARWLQHLQAPSPEAATVALQAQADALSSAELALAQ